MTATFIPVASALGFTLGCAGIHHLRRHAGRITPLLWSVVLVLIGALYVAWVVQGGPPRVDVVVVLDEAGVHVAASSEP